MFRSWTSKQLLSGVMSATKKTMLVQGGRDLLGFMVEGAFELDIQRKVKILIGEQKGK